MLRMWLNTVTPVAMLAASCALAMILFPQNRPAVVLEYNETRFYQRIIFVHYVDIERHIVVHQQMPLTAVMLQGSESLTDASRMRNIRFDSIGSVIQTSDTAPDGRRVITLPTPGNIDVFLVAPDTKRVQLTHFSDFPPRQVGRDPRRANIHPQWSPDAAWIVFLSSDEVGHLDLYAIRPDGSGLHRLAYRVNTEGSVEPRWVQLKTG